MGFTFCGEQLLILDSGHELADWFDRYFSLDDTRLYGPHLGLSDERTIPRSPALNKVGLGTPNWPAPPRAKLNSLYWPTGASRWATGWFLVDSDRLDKIVGKLTAAGSGEFKASESPTRSPSLPLTTTLYMLPPRPVWGPQTAESTDLFLLTLVDERYWWQFKDCGDLSVSPESGWGEVSSALMAAVGQSPATQDDGLHAYPHPLELTRRHESVGVVMDAAAASMGCRIVRRFDGVILWQRPATANQALSAQNHGRRLAGGDEFRIAARTWVPAQFKVVFQRGVNNVPSLPTSIGGTDVWTVTKNASAYTTAQTVAGMTRTVFSSGMADFSGAAAGGGTPNNLADLDALAGQLADDYYSWLEGGQDVVYPGIIASTMTGYDDYRWFHFAAQHPRLPSDKPWDDDAERDGDYLCYTRIAPLPENFGVSELLHWFDENSSSQSDSSSQNSSSSGPCTVMTGMSLNGGAVVVHFAEMRVNPFTGQVECINPTTETMDFCEAVADCTENPSGSNPTVSTLCCPGAIPRTLTGTFSDSSNCSGIAGNTVTLEYNDATSKWEGTVALSCGQTLSVTFTCDRPGTGCAGFVMEVFKGAVIGVNAQSVSAPLAGCSCNPLEVDFEVTPTLPFLTCCVAMGTPKFYITVTE